MRILLLEAILRDQNNNLATINMSSRHATSRSVYIDGKEWKPALTGWNGRTLSLTSSGQTQQAAISHGTVTFDVQSDLNNYDWSAFEWDGANIEIWSGEDGADFPSYRQAFFGIGGAVSRDGAEVSIPLLGVDALLTTNLLSATYGGTGGADGNTSLMGMLKPWTSGTCQFIDPLLIDSQYQVYQYHGYGPTQDVLDVFEYGQSINSNGCYATCSTYADLIALNLPDGNWAKAPAVGMFRLANVPSKKLSATVQGALDAGTFPQTIDKITAHVLKTVGVADSSIDMTSLLSFSSNLYGVYVNETQDVGDLLRTMLFSANGYLIPTSSGGWSAGHFFKTNPQGQLRQDRSTLPLVKSWKQLTVSPPVYSVRINAERCWNVHSSSDVSPAIGTLSDQQLAELNELNSAIEQFNDVTASAAQTAQDVAEIVDDGVLSRAEKIEQNQLYARESQAHVALMSANSQFNISSQRSAYDAAFQSLTTYLNSLSPAFSDYTQSTTINRTDYTNAWANYEAAKVNLAAAMANYASTVSTWAGTTGAGKPADNADVTGQNTAKDTSSVNGVPSTVITGNLNTVINNVSDLQTTFGNTVSSAASASAASGFAQTAQTAANNAAQASSDAISAKTAAVAAEGSAQTYSNQASNASQSASGSAQTASSAAGLAVSTTGQAQQAMAVLFPPQMVAGAPFLDHTNSAPNAAFPLIFDATYYSNVAGIGSVWTNQTAGFWEVCTVANITPVAGRSYDIETKVRIVTANTVANVANCFVQIQFAGLDANFNENGYYSLDPAQGYPVQVNNSLAFDWTVIKCRVTMPATVPAAYLKPRIYGNWNAGSGAVANAVYQIAYFKVSDVTEVVSADNSANASQQSAQTASTKADAAGTSASAAAGSALQASTYRDQANGYQSQAAGFAQNASVSADQASGSVTAANQQAINAQTQASNAQTYATQSQGYAAQSNASAAAAASSATLAASVGPGALNQNPYFIGWDADGSPANGWNWWDASFGVSRVGGINGHPYAAYFNVSNSTNNAGFVQTPTAAFGSFVFEISGRATTWAGAGLLVQFIDSNNTLVESVILDCAVDPDTSGYASSDGGGGAYTRSFSKFYKTQINGNIRKLNFYAMASWNGFQSNQSVKQIWIDKALIRPATASEIAAQRADSNAATALAQITTNQNAQADVNNAITTSVSNLKSFVTVGVNLCPDVDQWVMNGNGANYYYDQNFGKAIRTTSFTGSSSAILAYVDVPVYAGMNYTFSADLRAYGTTYAYLQIQWLDGNRNGIGNTTSSPAGQSREWGGSGRPFFITGLSPSNTAFARLWFVGNPNNYNGVVSIGIRQPKLEFGTNATAYTAEGALNAVQATVTQQSGTIASLQGRTAAFWNVETVAGTGRAQLSVHADANGGGGVDIIGDLSINGNLLVGGSVSYNQIAQGAVTQTIALSNTNAIVGSGSGGSSGGGSSGGGFGGGGGIRQNTAQ